MAPVLVQPWMPYPLRISSAPGQRDPHLLELVVRQFELEKNPRYTPRDLNSDGTQETFCNIFLWDYTRAMYAEIPHWADPNSGNPTGVGRGFELSANSTAHWLAMHGLRFGWKRSDEAQARQYAGRGCPAVAVWQHHGGIGHVAAVLPARMGETWIAQAGGSCFSRGPLSRGFGRISPSFWVHD